MAKSLADQRIVYTDDDGSVVVIIPAPHETGDNILTIEEIQAKDVPSGKASTIVDKSDVPTDRTFRNAWTFTP